MAAKNPVASGYWDEGTTWNGGSVPTIDDDVTINGGYTVSVRNSGSSSNRCQTLLIDGGDLLLSYNVAFLIKDAASPNSPAWHVKVKNTANSKLRSYATYNGWSVMRSLSDHPTYAINFLVETPSTTSPIINWMDPDGTHFFYLLAGHCSWFLGNSNVFVWFNSPQSSYVGKQLFAYTVGWPDRTPIIASHTIDGRVGDRIFREGEHSGSLEITGAFTMTGRPDMDLTALRDQTSPLCFISPYITLNRCYVESLRFRPGPGSAWVQYTMTLIEDL